MYNGRSLASLREFIVFLLCGFILVDMVNGVLLRLGFTSVSVVYKTAVLALVMLYMSKSRSFLLIVSAMVLTVLGYLLFHATLFSEMVGAFKSSDWLVKYFSIIIFYLFFCRLVFEGKGTLIFTVASYAIFFLTLNFIIGFLGLGYPMYGNEENAIGTKGLIFAGNEITASIVISGGIVQMKLIQESRYIQFLLVGLLMLFMGALLTSKVSLLAPILTTLFFPLIKSSEKLNVLKVSKKDFGSSALIIMIIPGIAFSFGYYALFQSNLMERLTYFYERVDVITLIFSRRNIWASDAIDVFVSLYSLPEVVLGTGLSWFQLVPDGKMVEIDFLDFLMAYGLLGVVISYGFVGLKVLDLLGSKNNPYFGYILFLILLVVAMSLSSGHIFNSGVAGALIGALFASTKLQKVEA
ncbi:hypothetical protein DXI23_01500 [Marinobacter flavimaris]|uniref:O-antigen ligase domain-containing protein n=1 Tax=Marinobacter flavimaris TaxID=262076 RepID=A0A3D8H7U3_9GAMM|nr:hypothetical protein [Marinobacter flavimaris]PPI81935.1 hypothetical protein MDHKLMBL_01500 [Marinobacter flavimaris]RDU42386.1 hypothetical protein DXI23_01500 [Marinobacter flavimaris]